MVRRNREDERGVSIYALAALLTAVAAAAWIVIGVYWESQVPSGPEGSVDLAYAAAFVYWVLTTALVWGAAIVLRPRWDAWRGRAASPPGRWAVTTGEPGLRLVLFIVLYWFVFPALLGGLGLSNAAQLAVALPPAAFLTLLTWQPFRVWLRTLLR